jgi:hypothetical protein
MKSKLAHPKRILPIVRHGISRLSIVSPESRQKAFEAERQGYLDGRGVTS